ncbi:hypothetical protein GALMADRAFT_135517 [Galerina marginata CBS 339.88]|uniref:Uncharacterized protein n=1 Tax=Galerina marginata (strain CBS 339.88) TaxID=685588 RepID=A0A067TG13_GALM3|nr:hypothetical protein GALMADRAFT_135517 [Galerina marginata CBS 339.88]
MALKKPSRMIQVSKNQKRARSPDPGPIRNGETAKRLKTSTPASASITKAESNSAESSCDDTSSAEDSDDDIPPLVGKFNLFSMSIPSLSEAYSPAGKSVNPEELYNAILNYQEKSGNTAEITIPANYAAGKDGFFVSPLIAEPEELGGYPFNISIKNITEVKKLTVFKPPFPRPRASWNAPAFKGRLTLMNPQCGISSSSGKVCIRPLWNKVDTDGDLVMELFEGSFDFKIVYGSMFYTSGYGRGQKLSADFWAIRRKS